MQGFSSSAHHHTALQSLDIWHHFYTTFLNTDSQRPSFWIVLKVTLLILFKKFLLPFLSTLYMRHALLIPPKIDLGLKQLVKDYVSLVYTHYFRDYSTTTAKAASAFLSAIKQALDVWTMNLVMENNSMINSLVLLVSFLADTLHAYFDVASFMQSSGPHC